MAKCVHCKRTFEPRRPGHIFCGNACRYAHRGDEASFAAEPEEVERLFDGRDDSETVAADEWHPSRAMSAVAAELDCWDSLGSRRQWYLTLVGEGP